ncbi:DNA cytosine methyltransferase [Vibrio hannami]|uniref:DNA cytosine methyltransferase n=1 Tax=Vibrio hannami TaxID=2717094 RepID=UPI003BB10E52
MKQQTYVAFDLRGREEGAVPESVGETVSLRAASGGSSRSYLAQPWAVRRLTPTECHRLQGFPDDHCDVTYRGKPAADGPQYKALGNSMAVPCVAWITDRMKLSMEEYQ